MVATRGRTVLKSVLIAMAAVWSGGDAHMVEKTGNPTAVLLPGYGADSGAGVRNVTLQMKKPRLLPKSLSKKHLQKENDVAYSSGNDYTFVMPLKEHPSSGLLSGHFYYGKAGDCIDLLIDTKASNTFVFDELAVKKTRPELFEGGADTMFYHSKYKSKRSKKKDWFYFEYADKSGYWGTKEKTQVQVMNPPADRWAVIKDKFVLALVDRMNDEAASIRGGGYAGVLGLNGLAKDTNGGTNFVQKLVAKMPLSSPSFSLFVASKERHTSNTGGMLFFGGIDNQFLAHNEEMAYFPVCGVTYYNGDNGGASSRRRGDEEEDVGYTAPSWAIRFEQLLIGSAVVLENFVAEFDSALPGGISDPSGYLARQYIEIAKTESKKKIGEPIYSDAKGEVLIDCSRVQEHAPGIQFVAFDEDHHRRVFDLKSDDFFTVDPNQKEGLCVTSFFEPEYKSNDGSQELKKVGDGTVGKPTTVRLGLDFMQYFYTDYRMPQKKPGEKKKKKNPELIAPQVGIGRARRDSVNTIGKDSQAIKKWINDAAGGSSQSTKNKKNKKNVEDNEQNEHNKEKEGAWE